jgi:hypothetical protein
MHCIGGSVKKKIPFSESTSERYRPSDRRLSIKLVPAFTDRYVSRGHRDGSPKAVTSVF